ncbi:MAG TPA: DUF4139 domain-containing protein [Phycisphaerales bacterium]|nr:MAG: hypothetical protein A2Y13_03295 [Planctomycetes bacterium GWC2_45_44]HBG78880.1 DUF4139 domain-containing protein [Phycisphaerales bacterium]HBR19153.1 DUF4139 domain-containing protein [Phycisphaerales bacterium]
MANKLCSVLLVFLACGILLAEEGMNQEDANSVAVTVYNDNFAVVKDCRDIVFAEGQNVIKFTDVASAIEPTSVNFQCITSPGQISVLEQNYEYDLVGTASLLNRYLDKAVEVSIKGSGADSGKKIIGVLLASADGNLIIKNQDDGIEIISQSSVENITLEELPEGLLVKPTLVWLAESAVEGSQNCQVSYTTTQIGWNADYSAILNADENALDISGWVTIDNKSGAAYKDATIKLIAGDVRRIVPPQRMVAMDSVVMKYNMAGAAPAFEEKSFMDYHLYTLQRKSTINNNQTKQIEFITPALNVPAKKIYLYERDKNADKVQVKFEFYNKKEAGLGIALPKGKVRVFKKDTDDSLEFVGEDLIDHTPKNEKILLYIGDAFDIAVEYKLLDSRVERRSRWEKHSIDLKNRKDEKVTVFVDEKFAPWVNWNIDNSTVKYVKTDAQTARFAVELEPDANVVLEYSATQTW